MKLNLPKKLSSFQRVIIGLVLGVVVGIFVGEPAGQLDVLGNTYVRLLQMTVLPYLLMSIVGDLGRLKRETAAIIGSRAHLEGLWHPVSESTMIVVEHGEVTSKPFNPVAP